MNRRRKFRPAVTDLEQRLALNGTIGAAVAGDQVAHPAVVTPLATHHKPAHHHKPTHRSKPTYHHK